MQLTDNWKDGSLYCAVIKTDHGKFTRVFSFDAHLTENECLMTLKHSLPNDITIEAFDDWGAVLTLKTNQAPHTHFLTEIEERFKLILRDESQDQSNQLRDLLSEMEVAYSDTAFNETLDNPMSDESILYTKLKVARDATRLP